MEMLVGGICFGVGFTVVASWASICTLVPLGMLLAF